jgi:hypothetical protein
MYIITFQSIHHVLKAEKVLLAMGVKFDIIPTPKDISSECGMSIRFDSENYDLEILKSTLQNEKLTCSFQLK